MRKIISVLAIVALVFTGCSSQSTSATIEEKIVVGVSITPLERFVDEVAGDHVETVTLVPQGYSPANYQPSPKELEMISDAKIFFGVDVPTEKNILPQIMDLNEDMKVIALTEEVGEVYDVRYFGEDDYSHDHDHDEECDHDHDHDEECDHDHDHDEECDHDHDHDEEGDHDHNHDEECDHDHDHDEECDHDHDHDEEGDHDHDHDEECDHDHDHDEECDHDHDHDEECSCGHDHGEECDHDHDEECDHDHDEECDHDHDEECDHDHDEECDHDHDEEENTNVIDHGDHVHEIGSPDPHSWMSPKRAIMMVEIIRDELIELLPELEEEFTANADSFIKELEEANQEIENILSDSQGNSFMMYHPSLGYYADDYGLDMVAIENDGKEATAKGLQDVIEFALEKDIKVVLYQEEFDSKQAEVVAAEVDGDAVMVNPLSYEYIEEILNLADILAEHSR